MSGILFLVGMALLGFAVVRAGNESDVSSSTMLIAGLSVADFILVFYTRPSRDVTRSLAVSERVKVIVTSYLAGLSLVKSNTLEQRQALAQLTSETVESLLKVHTASDESGTRAGLPAS